MKVKELKSLVRTKTSIPEDTYIRLVFASKELAEDDRTLESYGIQQASTIFMLLRLLGGDTLDLKILIKDKEEHKVSVNPNLTIFQLKEVIFATINSELSAVHMELSCAGVNLIDSKKIKEYNMLKDGAVLSHSKCSLEKVPGLLLSYDEDVFRIGDEDEAKAKMPCGHVVSRDGMTGFLKSLLDLKRYLILCPGRN